MNILLVERDDATSRQIHDALEALGHRVRSEPMKNCVANRLAQDEYDLLLLDPAPLNTPRPVVLSMRRLFPRFIYVLLLSASLTQNEAISAGTNDVLTLPASPEAISAKIENAHRLLEIVRHLGDTRTDFPSAGGIIAKSAFNELVLAGIERADRYGEKTHVLIITLKNHREMLNLDGAYTADLAAAKMAKFISTIRRQSDIIGQTERGQFMILLRAPNDDTEPVDAAKRFAESFEQEGYGQILSEARSAPNVSIALMGLPSGVILYDHHIEQKH